MILNLHQLGPNSTDLLLLHALLDGLVGEPVLRASVSYGDELHIHLGEPRPARNKKMAGETVGSWLLATRASRWRFLLSQQLTLVTTGTSGRPGGWQGEGVPAVSDLDGSKAEKALEPVAGQRVVAVETFSFPVPNGFEAGVGLRMSLSGSELVVLPSPEPDPDAEPLADLELFTPFGHYLSIGPGLKWSWLPFGGAERNGHAEQNPT